MSCTLVDVLRSSTQKAPDHTAYTFLGDGAPEPLTNAALEARARALGARLQDAGPTGSRAVLLVPPSLDFVVGFFGCLLGGWVAVPAYPPDPSRLAKTLPRLLAILADSQASVVLTTTAVLRLAELLLPHEPGLRQLRWLAVDDIPIADGAAWRDPVVTPQTLAFLQYTSGSTARPRGVMLTHGITVTHLQMIRRTFELGPSDTFVNWLPVFHDMGLIGNILESYYAAAHCVFMSPATFLRHPYAWLKALSEYRGTLSCAPSFAFELCVRKVTDAERATLDLSHWSKAPNGAEPVRPQTLERFAERFACCGFRREAFFPGFGLAEACLLVTGSWPPGRGMRTAWVGRAALAEGVVRPTSADDPDARWLCGSGTPVVGADVVIADPATGLPLRPERIGEIWVKSDSLCAGYWGNPAESAHTFGATFAGRSPYLRTGDLGFFHEGELYVTGRLKDLIIVHGRNHYPQDIETTVEQLAGVRPGCCNAFTIDDEAEERLIVVAELAEDRLHTGSEAAPTPELAAAVREQLAAKLRSLVLEEHDVPVDRVVFLKPGALPKTSSGKLQRSRCRAELLEGSLETLSDHPLRARAAAAPPQPDTAPSPAPAPQAAAIRAWLLRHLAQELSIAPESIDARMALRDLGLDSAKSASLSGELSRWLGREVAIADLYGNPTIDQLARFLGGEAPAGVDPAAEPRPKSGARTPREPIAIVGMACRFPGASGVAAYWELLRDGKDAVGEIPAARWDNSAYYSPDPEAPGKMVSREGAFLDGAYDFDAAFFGVSRREAIAMDPQQRLLLELTHEALEDAGIPQSALARSRTGVFMGLTPSGYSWRGCADPTQVDSFTALGAFSALAANRISYFYDLQGPSYTVDAVCSSSLLAVHLACKALWEDECSLAIVGGATLLLSPDGMLWFSKLGVLSPTGRCRPFGSEADGIALGEGAASIVLKPLSRALADGDPVHAVLLGGATVQDGRSNGLTAPSEAAQQALLRAAYEDAGVQPAQVHYVEAHGTGTIVGDPIEARALGAVLGAGRDPHTPCYIGSVKSNLGHLSMVGGLASLIKTVLALKHRQLPASLHFGQGNPKIDFAAWNLRVPTALSAFPGSAGAERAVAGVTSLSFGGTNVHLVVAQAPAGPERAPQHTQTEPHILPLSAHSAPALRAHVAAMRDLVEQNEPLSLDDLCYTAAVRRGHHAHRMAVLARSRSELHAGLTAFLERSGDSLPAGTGHSEAVCVAGDSDRQALADTYCQGAPVDWSAVYPRGRIIALPRYPWQHETLCFAAPPAPPPTQSAGASQEHPGALRWERSFDLSHLPYLADHTVHGAPVLPAVSYVEMARVAAEEVYGPGLHRLGLTFERAAPLAADKPLRLVLTASRSAPLGMEFTVARADDAAVVHARGAVLPYQDIRGPAAVDPEKRTSIELLCAALPHELPADDFYRIVEERDALYGPAFRRIERFWRQDGEALGRISPSGIAEDDTPHPAVLDACLQVLLCAGMDRLRAGLQLPTRLDSLVLFPCRTTAAPFYCHARVTDGGRADRLRGEFVLYDGEGRTVAQAAGVEFAAPGERRSSEELYEVTWEPVPHSGAAADGGSWILFADGRGVGAALTRELVARKGRCIVVTAGTRCERRGGDAWELRVDVPGDYAEVLRQVLAEVPTCRGVVHLFSLDAATAAEPEALQACEQACISALHLVQALPKAGAQPPRLWLITQGAQPAVLAGEVGQPGQASLWGLGRVIAHEYPELLCTNVDLGPRGEDPGAESLARELLVGAQDYHVVLGRSGRWVGRLQTAAPRPTRRIRSTIAAGGPVQVEPDPSYALHAVQLRHVARRPPGPGEIEIAVTAASLNFRNLMHALGQSPIPEGDCVGRILAVGSEVDDLAPGQEVIAIASQHLSSHITVDKRRVWRKPAQLTAEQAVTVGSPFTTAFYALCHLARLAPGERVLIHSAAGGVGMAAVQIARSCGAEVYATAGTAEKRQYLVEALGVRRAWDSRSFDFARDISADLGGVDVVLNSLGGEFIEKSLATLRSYGRFLELGVIDILQNRALKTAPFRKNLSFFAIDMAAIRRDRLALYRELMAEVLDRIDSGALAPLPTASFPFMDAASALRKMASAHHMGKLLLLPPQPAEPCDVVAPPPFAAGTYVVTGGLTGIGLAVAEWLCQRGARHVALLGRRAPAAEAVAAMQRMAAGGAAVRALCVDVACEAALKTALAELAQWGPPLRGIFHCAAAMDDAPIAEMDGRRFKEVMAAKAHGAWNLHRLTRDQPLQTFVLFSSMSALLGLPGQSSYAAANAFLDGLAHYRRAQGLPAVSINWGLWAEVGAAARAGIGGVLGQRGLGSLSRAQGLAALEYALAQDTAQLAVMPIDWDRFASFYPALPQLPLLKDRRGQPRKAAPVAQEHPAAFAVLAAAPDEQLAVVGRHLRQLLAKILECRPDELELARPLFEIGISSLVALDLTNALHNEFGIDLPATQVLTDITGAQLARQLLARLCQADPGAASQVLVPLRVHAPSAKPPLFCIHGSGGQARIYARFPEAFPADQPLYGLQSRALSDPAAEFSSPNEMASAYVEAIRTRQPHGPYQVLGWSLGGLLAMLIAAELERQGESVAFLGVLDPPPPVRYLREHQSVIETLVAFSQLTEMDVAAAMDFHKRHDAMLRDLPVEEHASRLLQLAQANKRSGYVASPELVSAQLPLLRTHSMLSRRFRAPTLRAHIDLWLARDQIWPGAHADWADLTKTQVETHWAEGNHFDMVRAPNDAGLARAIRRIQEMRCPQK